MRHRQRATCVLVVIAVALSIIVYRGRADGPPIVISEVLVGNASTNLDPAYFNYSSWIELHNTGVAAVNLSGLRLVSLREGHATPQSYTLPNISIPADGRVLVWYDELTVGGLHVPYELDMDGGWIELRTAAGAVIDNVTLGAQRPDVSYGRDADGGWAFFDPPTPGAANASPSFAVVAGTVAAAPAFSVPGGRYNGARAVELSTTEPAGVIRYTLDGSKPTPNSPVYSSPIAIATTKVLRARTFAAGRISSATITHTYLINVPANLPAISLATDPAHMFDNIIGIFVQGTNGLSVCGKKANWNQPWERPASVEMYDTNGARLFAQDAGLEMFGNCSRNLKFKSFELKARKEYGDNDFSAPLFADRSLISYRRLVLRTGGQDAANTTLRDALGSQMLSGQMSIERGAWRPTVVYVNGEFWGVYNLREKTDEDLIENHYGLDEETDFDALSETGNVVLAGSNARWNEFYNYIKTHDPADPAVYAYLQTQMDMVNYIDYQIAEIYAANTDWPQGNIRFWRAYAPGSKWRWILHDLDTAFGNDVANGAGNNTLKLAMSKKGAKAYHGLILRQLTRNADFRALFTQRFAVYLNTTFAPARMITLVNSMSGQIAADMPAQVARWAMPKNVTFWNTQLTKLRTFVQKRPPYVFTHLNTYLGNPGTVTLTTVAGAGGDVRVAGVEAPDNYSGLAFKSTPLTLTAVPAPGQLFVRWAETGQTTPEITVTLNGPATYTAIFDAEPPPPPVPHIVINEILYRPLPEADEPDKEFIELYHAGSTPADLSGYTISAISYTFPNGSQIDPGEYIVVAANGADPAYAALPTGNVFDWAWGDDNDHKLSNSTEAVTLRHADGRVVDTVTYNDDPPWPTEPDGNGPSLALLDETLDNALPESWARSRENGGTPGAENFPPLPPVPAIVINEIHYNPADSQGSDTDYEFIELVNTSAGAVVLEGYALTGVDFTFGAGASIAAGERIVVAANVSTYAGSYQVFQWAAGELADNGETLTLTDGYGQTVDAVTYGDGGDWPAAPDGSGPTLSLGDPALDNSVAANWAASDFAGGTPGAGNWPPLPLVVSEVHYSVNATLQPGGDNVWEFLELVNAGNRAFDLSGYTTEGITYTFPAGTSIAAGETIVLANDGATYAGAGCAVYDWTSGGLSSSGETITFRNRFGAPVLVFAFGTAAPWPTEPKGGGPSLALLDLTYDNSLPASWAKSRETGGTPCAENFPPLPPVPAIVINEIHYNPDAAQGPDAGYEFIELVNTGSGAVALEGYTLTGVGFTFGAGASIAAGEHIVVAAHAATYSGTYQTFQWTAGELADDGETLTLTDGYGQTVDEVAYDDTGDWPAAPDGGGPTLSLGLPALNNSNPASWAASREVGGTPGAANFPPLPLVINELHHTPSAAQGSDNDYEFLELYNAGATTIDLSGYNFVGVDATLPNGATIAAGEYIVVADTPASYGGGYQVFNFDGGLSSSGERVAVLDRFGTLVDEVTYGVAAPWPSTPNGGGPSLALLEPGLDNSLAANWAASRETGGTPGAENFPPLPPVAAIVINEIHYNPDDAAQGPDADYEFIELVNAGGETVTLEGYALTGVDYTFAAGASIAAGEHIIIAANAATYSSAYQTFQWTAGELADDGETLTLTDNLGRTVDTVAYGDAGDWPAAPDGGGRSLALRHPADDNSVATNWAASNELGGTPGAANGL